MIGGESGRIGVAMTGGAVATGFVGTDGGAIGLAGVGGSVPSATLVVGVFDFDEGPLVKVKTKTKTNTKAPPPPTTIVNKVTQFEVESDGGGA
jgi:hypothetical protein